MKTWSKYNNFVFKIMLFLIILVFGALVSGGDWLIGAVCAGFILLLLEIDEAYQKGKKEGRQEHLEEKERLMKQVTYFNKIEKNKENKK